jgi:ATP-dependent DNA helicase RecG
VGTWLGRLLDFGLVNSKGKTKGTEYFVNSDFLKKTSFKGKTNLKGIEKHRLEELIRQDIRIYQPTSIGDIHTRIGLEIPRRKIRLMLNKMCEKGILFMEGVKATAKYALDKKQLK